MIAVPLPRDAWPRLPREGATRVVLTAIYGLVLLLTTAEIVRSLFRTELVVFHGYVTLGQVASFPGSDPYLLHLNTWPPFFLLVAIGLARLARISEPFALGMWQIGGALATWGCCRLAAELFLERDQRVTFWPRDAAHYAFGSAPVLVPFLLTARLFQEHLQHTQINVQVLFLILLAFMQFRNNRAVRGGAALALAVSLKAVPVLLLVYLGYKRAWRPLAWTLGFLVVFNVGLTAAAFGPGRATGLWRSWRAVASREASDPVPQFRNQSLLAALKRVLSAPASEYDPIHYAVANWSIAAVRRLFVATALTVALWLAWRFRRHSGDWTDPNVAAELAILLGAMVVVDPLAWKAHYVVLIVPTTFAWWALRRTQEARWWQWGMFWGSAACTTLSAPAIVGNHARDVLESMNAILVGAVLLLVLAVTMVPAVGATGESRLDATDAQGKPG